MNHNIEETQELPSLAGSTHRETKVQVLPRNGNEISHSNCLVVEPYRDAPDDPELFATVEHFVKNQDASGFPWRITPVGEARLPFKTALDVAVQFAKGNGVPVILVNQDGLSTEAEKRQTDTRVLRVAP